MIDRSIGILWASTAALALGLLAGMLGRGCAPAVTPSPAPTVAAVAIASASSRVVASQSVRITITRPSYGVMPQSRQKTASQDRPQGARLAAPGCSILPSRPAPEPSVRPAETRSLEPSEDAGFYWPLAESNEVITIEVGQAISSDAASGAAATASAPVVKESLTTAPHSRIGVALTTMPGVLALDLEVLQMQVPPWVIGVPLEVGADLVGNLQAAGAAVSIGGKLYALGGYHVTWQGAHGPLLGAGCRF